MNLHYKIIEIHSTQHSIVVRYFTDVLTETSLCSQFNADGTVLMRADGQIARCRTDFNFDLPVPAPTGADLDAFIRARAPTGWLQIQESVASPAVDTSMSQIQPLLNVVQTPTVTLDQAKSSQSDQINSSCTKAIAAGFSSSALGATHTYPAKSLDQQNLNASVTDALVALSSPAWSANTLVAASQVVTWAGQAYVCTAAGTTAASAPAWPTAVGATAADGTAQWRIWTTAFWCADSTGAWAYTDHTAPQIKAAGVDGKASIMTSLRKCQNLQAQIQAATTVAQAQAVVW